MDKGKILVTGATGRTGGNDLHFPPFLVQHLIEVAQDYQGGEIFSGANDYVERITGTPATKLSDYIREHRSVLA